MKEKWKLVTAKLSFFLTTLEHILIKHIRVYVSLRLLNPNIYQIFKIQDGRFNIVERDSKKYMDFNKNWYSRVFELAESKYAVELSKFKMAYL